MKISAPVKLTILAQARNGRVLRVSSETASGPADAGQDLLRWFAWLRVEGYRIRLGATDARSDAVACFGGAGARGVPAHREPGAEGASDSGDHSHGDWHHGKQRRGRPGRAGVASRSD